MRETKRVKGIAAEGRLAVDTKELQGMLGCGRATACEIGLQAGARMQLGKRVLWNVEKVRAYLNRIAK